MSDRPDCPYCHNPMTLNGTQTSGARIYRCRRGCKTPEGKTPTHTDSDRKQGGQLTGDRKITQAEATARWKERDPEGYKQSRKRSRSKKKMIDLSDRIPTFEEIFAKRKLLREQSLKDKELNMKSANPTR